MVRIEYYSTDRIPDPDGNATGLDFHETRNAIVRACRRHGPTGPFGVLDLDRADGKRDLFDIWERGDPDAVYYVVDDQYNSERYQYVECDADYLTDAWILDLMASLVNTPSWGVGICCIPMAYVLIFADRIMVTGEIFKNVNDLATLTERARHSIVNHKSDGNCRRSGDCKAYTFEGDKLVVDVDYGEGATERSIIELESVESVWRNPFTGSGNVSLKSGENVTLSDDEAFAKIDEWLKRAVRP
jgi:hypothetical protein